MGDFSRMEGPTLRIQLLGGFCVWVGETPVLDREWRLRKSSAIVKLLALAPGCRLLQGQLCDTLWPDLVPDAARNNLNYAVYAARRTLGDARWLSNDGKVLSLPEGTSVDAAAFARAAERAQLRDEPDASLAAIERYGGELLLGDRYEEWAAGPRERLRDLFVSVVMGRAALDEQAGMLARAAALLQRGLAAEPAREELHTALMLVYARMGRHSEVRRQFQQLRDVLRREMDSEPDPATMRLYEAIQRGDLPATPRIGEAAGQTPWGDAKTRRRDAAYYLRLAQDLAPRTLGPDGQAVLARLERDREHFNAALDWAVEAGETSWGLLLASELVALWNLRGQLGEGRAWLAKLLALPEPPPEKQTRAYLAARARVERGGVYGADSG